MFEDGFYAGAVEGVSSKVDEYHVAVCAVGDELEAEVLELDFEGFGVFDDLFLVLLEFGSSGLFEGNGESGDGVIMWSTLMAGEDGEIYGSFEVVQDLLPGFGVRTSDTLSEEDHGTSGSSERFVGGRCDDICIFKW